MKQLDMFELSENEPVLAGIFRGRQLLSRLIGESEPASSPEPLFLDFQKVELVTGSFFREAILGFRDFCLNQRTNLVPIVANVDRTTLEEFLLVLESKGDAIVVCDIVNGQVQNARVVGVLEEKQIITLEAVLQAKETDAVSLKEKFRDVDAIKTTSWNNRLVSLAAKGILVERKKGRLKLYRPILEVSYGY